MVLITPKELVEASRFWPLVTRAADYCKLDRYDVIGIMSRESRCGLLLKNGLGDNGNAYGLMQIDGRYHKAFIDSGKALDPWENIFYACNDILLKYRNSLQVILKRWPEISLQRAYIAAFNTGPSDIVKAIRQGRDVDYYTARPSRNYSTDVLARAEYYKQIFEQTITPRR